MPQRQLTALDGATANVLGDALVFVDGATSSLVVEIDGGAFEFEAGGTQFGSLVADWLDIDLSEAFDWQGGVLEVGSRHDGPRPTFLGVWTGGQHSVKLSARYIEYEQFLDLWRRIRVVETPNGIALHKTGARDSARFPVRDYVPIVTQPLADYGLLEVRPLTARVRAQLPAWEGASARHGELYVEEGDDEKSTTFLLVTDSCVVRLYPYPQPDTYQAQVDAFVDMDAEWTYA